MKKIVTNIINVILLTLVIVLIVIMFAIAFSGCQSTINVKQDNSLKIKEIVYTRDYMITAEKPTYCYKMNNGLIMFSDTLYSMSDEFYLMRK